MGCQYGAVGERFRGFTYRAIDKRISLMRPHRLNESRRALEVIVEDRSQRLFAFDFNFAVGPARDFYNSVYDHGVVFVRVKRDLET